MAEANLPPLEENDDDLDADLQDPNVAPPLVIDGNLRNNRPAQNLDNAIRQVQIKLPPFWKQDPDLWFLQIEAQFATAAIRADNSKFNQEEEIKKMKATIEKLSTPKKSVQPRINLARTFTSSSAPPIASPVQPAITPPIASPIQPAIAPATASQITLPPEPSLACPKERENWTDDMDNWAEAKENWAPMHDEESLENDLLMSDSE